MEAELIDPRNFARAPDRRFAPLLALAAQSLDASGAEASADADRKLDCEIGGLFDDASGARLAGLFAAAPSVALYRHLWRRLAHVMSVPVSRPGENLAAALFAIPVVIVAGRESGDGEVPLPATLADVAALAAIFAGRDAHALGGHRSFALANVLAAAHAIDIAQLPRLRAAAIDALGGTNAALSLEPAPVGVANGESVHLRFIVGSALTGAHTLQLRGDVDGAWAMPLAKALATQLAVPATTVLALPRAPAALPQALAAGRLAQREVAAQVFASNALRRMRASVGEPVAIISAHRMQDDGGELRLSLSSPFSPRDAEGFRCPLFAFEPVADALLMLEDLLRDCGVTDVRVEPGIHGDRDPGTGLALLFKPPSTDAGVAWPRPR